MTLTLTQRIKAGKRSELDLLVFERRQCKAAYVHAVAMVVQVPLKFYHTRVLTYESIVQVDHATDHVADLDFSSTYVSCAMVPFQTLRDNTIRPIRSTY